MFKQPYNFAHEHGPDRFQPIDRYESNGTPAIHWTSSAYSSLEYLRGINKNLFKLDETDMCCRVCNIQFKTSLTLNKHLVSKKHAAKLTTKCRKKSRRKNVDKSNVCDSKFKDFSLLPDELIRSMAADLTEYIGNKLDLFTNIEMSNLPDLVDTNYCDDMAIRKSYFKFHYCRFDKIQPIACTYDKLRKQSRCFRPTNKSYLS